MKMEDYLYHCAGCKKPDKEYPNEETECDECVGEDCGAFVDEDGYCWKCGGKGYYLDKISVEYHRWSRVDAYGIYTGRYCDKCYNNPHKYIYRKDRYHDEAYCGERINPDE